MQIVWELRGVQRDGCCGETETSAARTLQPFVFLNSESAFPDWPD
jgi:hypothetical protein